MKKTLIALITVVMLAACNQTPKTSSAEGNTNLTNEQIIQTLKEAYEFGFPLIVMHATQQVGTNVDKVYTNGRIAAPINQMSSATQFPDDKFRDVVRPNNDTYYSSASLDLKSEPMVLQIPNTNGRYALFPLLDAWTNVFFSPGKRTTGTDAQTYLITGPAWSGEVPANMKQVKSPTNLVWLIGRIQVNNEKDGATTVKKIQDGMKLIPLSAWGKPFVAPAGKIDPAIPQKTPNDIVLSMPVTDYFNLLNKLMIDNPPAAADADMLKKLAPLGIAPGGTFDASKFPSTIQDSINSIPTWSKNNMIINGLSNAKPVNGWSVNAGLGDYKTNYAYRAGVAFGGLGANLDADAIYPASMTDIDGVPYNGSKHKYVWHIDAGKEPPANAFWSLTMYDNNGFLCANPIRRFAIGDRNNLKKNADGSVDIFIQKDNPGKDKESNWLPAPDGPFNLLLRIYWPKEEMTHGNWIVPGVKKQS
jgi:hypothetical protein